LIAFLSRKAHLVFSAVIFSTSIFLQ